MEKDKKHFEQQRNFLIEPKGEHFKNLKIFKIF